MLGITALDYSLSKMACEQSVGIHRFRTRDIEDKLEIVEKCKPQDKTVECSNEQGVMISLEEGYSFM